MSALGLVGTSAPVPDVTAPPTAGLKFHLEDTLASADALWLRGRVSLPEEAPARPRRWWPGWRAKGKAPAPPPAVALDVTAGSVAVHGEAPVRADGSFEALVPAALRAARRGWRVAQVRATHAGRTGEACNVVLAPPEAGAVAVVLLPAAVTARPGGALGLAAADCAGVVPALLQQCGEGGPVSVYYLAATPADAPATEAEWALAATALGWPSGPFVLLPAAAGEESARLLHGLDCLRRLWAGAPALEVVNLEPRVAADLKALPAGPERADVRRVLVHQAAPFRPTPVVQRGYRPRPARPTRAALVPRHPVVFCHGMLAFSMLRMSMPDELNCFSALREFLRDRGVRALFPQVPPTSGVAARAELLRDQVRHWTDEPVNLIAHSMGGLDAREMITRLGMGGRVRSLTTVCTPHRGTHLADWFLANYRRRVPLLLALEALGVNLDGFQDCRPAACAAFNARTPDDPRVRYFSFGGAVASNRLSPALRRAWSILTPVEGPNDGMVSAGSARWGEYLGTVHADHFAQTPDAVFLRPGEDFDALAFYGRLVEDLARRGF